MATKNKATLDDWRKRYRNRFTTSSPPRSREDIQRDLRRLPTAKEVKALGVRAKEPYQETVWSEGGKAVNSLYDLGKSYVGGSLNVLLGRQGVKGYYGDIIDDTADLMLDTWNVGKRAWEGPREITPTPLRTRASASASDEDDEDDEDDESGSEPKTKKITDFTFEELTDLKKRMDPDQRERLDAFIRKGMEDNPKWGEQIKSSLAEYRQGLREQADLERRKGTVGGVLPGGEEYEFDQASNQPEDIVSFYDPEVQARREQRWAQEAQERAEMGIGKGSTVYGGRSPEDTRRMLAMRGLDTPARRQMREDEENRRDQQLRQLRQNYQRGRAEELQDREFGLAQEELDINRKAVEGEFGQTIENNIPQGADPDKEKKYFDVMGKFADHFEEVVDPQKPNLPRMKDLAQKTGRFRKKVWSDYKQAKENVAQNLRKFEEGNLPKDEMEKVEQNMFMVNKLEKEWFNLLSKDYASKLAGQ